MEIPKIKAPDIISNTVSNSKTAVTNAISSVSTPSFPLLSAPKVSLPSTDLLKNKLPSTDLLKNKLPSTDLLKNKLPSAGALSSAAKARALAKLPSMPDVPGGMAGIMTPGVDLSTFQAKTMANLISIVPPHIPGKSSLGIAKALKLASAAKSKLAGLKALSSGLTGKISALSGLAGKVSGLGGGPVSDEPTQKSEIPDLTKNTKNEVESLADQSSQSVPKSEPTPTPISSISPPQNITTSLETNGQLE